MFFSTGLVSLASRLIFTENFRIEKVSKMLIMKRPFLTILMFPLEVILVVISEFRSYFRFRVIYSVFLIYSTHAIQ